MNPNDMFSLSWQPAARTLPISGRNTAQLYTAYGHAVDDYAPVSDRRKRRAAKAYKKALYEVRQQLSVQVAPFNPLPEYGDWCDLPPFRPTIVDRPQIGGTHHANACVGKSGKWGYRSDSAAKAGRDLYLLGKPAVAAHAQGM